MEKQSESHSKAWNPVIIGLASFLFTFLPGGIFYAINFERLGKPKKKTISLILVIIGFSVFAAALLLVPEDVPTVPIFTLINAFVSGLFIYSQRSLYIQYLEKGGEKTSALLPVTVSILWFISISVIFLYLPIGEPSELDLNPGKSFVEAAYNGNIDDVMYLLERGIDINIYHKGRTALFEAAINGKTEVLKLLIQKGADTNAKDQEGLATALYMVAMNNRGGYEKTNEIIKLLVEGGANTDLVSTYSNITPLMWLASNGNIEGVKYIVEKGADINIRDEDGKIALDYAEKGKHSEIIEYLKEKGQKLDIN